MIEQEAPPATPCGLTAAEAAKRLAADGPNELPAARPRGLAAVVREVLREPMFMLLAAAAGTYLLIGDVREALVLLASVFVVMGITIYQERKSERALEALRDLSSPRALVLIIPSLRDLFRLAAPSVADVAFSVVAALVSVLWFELYKFLRYRRTAVSPALDA